jgi:hypothetical protein
LKYTQAQNLDHQVITTQVNICRRRPKDKKIPILKTDRASDIVSEHFLLKALSAYGKKSPSHYLLSVSALQSDDFKMQ